MKYFLLLSCLLFIDNTQICLKKISINTYYAGEIREIGPEKIRVQAIIKDNNLKIKLGITAVALQDSLNGVKWGLLTDQILGLKDFVKNKPHTPINITGYWINCNDSFKYYIITDLKILKE